MSRYRRLSHLFSCASLVVLLASTGATARNSGYCPGPVRSTDTHTARVSAEINSQGDLLVLLDTNEDDGPEYALHGATRQPEKLAAVVKEIQALSGPARVLLLLRTPVGPSAFEIRTDQQDDSEAIRAMVGPRECFPDETGTDLWLTGLAHYTLSTLEPLANSTVERLRESSLIQGRTDRALDPKHAAPPGGTSTKDDGSSG